MNRRISAVRAQWCFAALLTLLSAGCAATSGTAAMSSEPVIDLRADDQLRRMTDYLKGLDRLRFEVDVTYDDYLVDDELVQKHRRSTVEALRPDRLRGSAASDDDERAYWFDGSRLTFLDRRNNVYSEVAVAGSIDTLIETLADKYDVVNPVMEFLSTDAYRWLMGNVSDAEYVGEVTLAGEKCHHLAYRQPTLDWQIWISAGDAALPRKLVIRYKQLTGYPQYQAVFSSWDTAPNFSAADFAAQVPADAGRVEFQPQARAVGSGTKPQ
ncbi:MAG: DUF2092 domain-containing protein [Phycisphaerales bacterium]|nr:DUF2092 domain-containing protein [Phycisphaerales bacterium]